DLIVLAVGVVVTALRTQDFVAAQNHRHALAKQQRSHEVLRLPVSHRNDALPPGRTFDAVVATVVVIVAVAVLFEIRKVVLAFIANKIVNRKAVVRSNEVNTVIRPATARLIKVAGTRQPRCDRTNEPRVAAPEPAHVVAEVTVPLGP